MSIRKNTNGKIGDEVYEKKEKRSIEGKAIEIIEILYIALHKQLPDNYKTEKQLKEEEEKQKEINLNIQVKKNDLIKRS